MVHSIAIALLVVMIAIEPIYGENVMPLEFTNTIKDSSALAVQTSREGGVLTGHGCQPGKLRLKMLGAENVTAIVPDLMDPAMGIDMVPPAAIGSSLPRFAVIVMNNTEINTDHAGQQMNDIQILAVNLLTLEESAHGKLGYMIEVIDPDLGSIDDMGSAELPTSSEGMGDSSDAARDIEIMNLAKDITVRSAARPIPESFKQATLLIDLVDPSDASKRHMSLRHMAESGELSQNIHKFMQDPDAVVSANGVLTIGWMLPWSLWAWICCPTVFLLMPWAVPVWMFCCI